MKSKMIVLALATTVFLGGCCDMNRHHQQRSDTNVKRSDTTYSQTMVYGTGAERLNTDDVRKVQRSLAQQGYYKGQIDGVWGQETSQAILMYQLAHQHSQTGTLTVDDLHAFGVQMDRDAYRATRN